MLVQPTCRTSCIPGLRTSLSSGKRASESHSETLCQIAVVDERLFFCIPVLSTDNSTSGLPPALFICHVSLQDLGQQSNCHLMAQHAAYSQTALKFLPVSEKPQDSVSIPDSMLAIEEGKVLTPFRRAGSTGHLPCDVVHTLGPTQTDYSGLPF